MLFLSRSHCGSCCSVFIFTDRIYCRRAHRSGGLPGWWSSRSSLETHCLSLPYWEINILGFFFFFLAFTFPAGTTLVPKSLIWPHLKWTMFALIVGKFTNNHGRQFAKVQTWQEQEERWGGKNPSPCGPTLPNIEVKANYGSTNGLDGCECLMDTWVKNHLEVKLWLFL